MNSPCKGRPNRFLGCHSVCAGYQEFQAERELISERRQKQVALNGYTRDAVYKSIKSSRENPKHSILC